MTKMRNEEFLQNYRASQFKVALTGKTTNTFTITDDMRDYLWWVELFNNAIDDIKAGGRINGKVEKNSASYWLVQRLKLNEFINEKGLRNYE